MKRKPIAIVLSVLTVLFAAAVLYGWRGATLQVTGITFSQAEASAHADTFHHWQNAMDNNAVTGTPLASSLPGSEEDYVFFAYTVHLKNNGLLDAEMVELQLDPANGDVLYYTAENAADINVPYVLGAGQAGDMQLILLTSAQNSTYRQFDRTLTITYYVWGIPVTITAQYRLEAAS